MIKLGVKNCSRGGKLLPAFFFTRFYSLSEGDKEKDGRNQQPFRHGTEASFGCRATVSRGRARARKAGVKSAAVAVRRSLAYAPCGDAGGKGDAVAATRRLRRKSGKEMRARRGARGKPEGAYGVPAKILRSKRFAGRGEAGIKALPRQRRGGQGLPCFDEPQGDKVLRRRCFARLFIFVGF